MSTYWKIVLFITVFLGGSTAAHAKDRSKDFAITIKYTPSSFIQYEGEGARTTGNNTWESKIKSHDALLELEVDYKLTEKSGVNLQYLANFATIEDERSSSGLQYNDVIFKIRNTYLNYYRELEGSGLSAIVGYQYLQQSFDRSRFFLYPEDYVDMRHKEEIESHGLNFGILGRYFSPVYLDIELMSGILLKTKNRQTADISTLKKKGYTYRVRLEVGADISDYSFGLGAIRELYHPQVDGGASQDGAIYSYSQNKIDLMGIYIFTRTEF